MDQAPCQAETSLPPTVVLCNAPIDPPGSRGVVDKPLDDSDAHLLPSLHARAHHPPVSLYDGKIAFNPGILLIRGLMLCNHDNTTTNRLTSGEVSLMPR